LPAQVGRYQIEGEIARGGIGIVLRAHDTAFHRTVALKLLQPPQASPDMAQRFLEEAQVLGQLQHPGIPPVHDLGTLPDGRPFFAMKLIKGRTLAELLKERPSPAHELPCFLAIFGQLCQAVAYAHSRGILHRDLKPSNVMVGAFGEVQVMDWGLAKVLGQQRAPATAIEPEERSTIYTVRTSGLELSTQSGAVMGTPAYMAPEQARGEVDQLDERCDVFGLGAILCVLLTGQPPYVGPRTEVRRQAALAELADAYGRLERCGADAELVALAKACLAPERAQRPRQAGEVAEAMAAYQAQVQERLRQAEVARAQAQVKAAEERKRRRLGQALASALLLLLAGAVGAAYWYQQERQARRSQAEGGVRLNLKEATVLGERAWTLIDNPPSWKTTLDAALAAVQRAEAIVEQEPELVDGELAQEVAQVQARLRADEKDRVLLAAFDKVREEQSQMESGSRLKVAEPYALLKRALQEYGLPVGEGTPERAAALLRGRPGVMQGYLAAILQESWRLAPKAGETHQQGWLAAVLAAADGDGWRQQVRQALAAKDWGRLEQLLGQAEATRQHPAFLVGVALALPTAGPPSKLGLLRRAQQQHPDDFWVNFALAFALHDGVLAQAAKGPARTEELPVVQEVVRYYTVAVALRPGSAPAHHDLGLALKFQGNVSGAIACHKKALELEPKYVYAHAHLGLALWAQGDLKGAIACFEQALTLDPKFAPAHYNLGRALAAQKDWKGAIVAFRKAVDLDPKDLKAHNSLGTLLCDEERDYEGAIAAFQQALALDPQDPQNHYNLGNALLGKKDLAEAIASYQKALALDPKYAQAHGALGLALQRQGDLRGAIGCFKKALDLDPKLADAHTNLGLTLFATKDVSGAIDHYRKAIEIDPKLAEAHNNLGNALYAQGDVKEAIACYQKALAIDPKYAMAHYNLGNALYKQGDVKGAITCYRKALDLDPKYAPAHHNLGNALKAQGDLKGAITCFKKALDLDPKYAMAHYSLGNALRDQRDLKGAVASFKKALVLAPKFVEAHCNLGHALREQGDFAQALQALQQGHLLGSQRPDWRYPSAQWVQQCQYLLELDKRLPAILQGDAQPKDSAEQLALADLCRYKQRYHAAARFYAAALAAKPKLSLPQEAFFRYNAACAGVLAAAGKGEDAAQLDAKEKPRLRQQALTWLRDNLKLYNKQLEDAEAKGRAALQQLLLHWQQDTDLVAVREAEALAKLPEAERALWQQLWADVEALRKKAQPE
jgi:tetratricopeptide (TPR) repeat protein